MCPLLLQPSSLQNGVLSLQTGAGRKRCALHVSRSANWDTQFAKWYSLQIRCASSATSLQTELLRPTVCKLRPSLQTAAKVSPSLQTGLSLQTEPVRRLRPTYTIFSLRHVVEGNSGLDGINGPHSAGRMLGCCTMNVRKGETTPTGRRER